MSLLTSLTVYKWKFNLSPPQNQTQVPNSKDENNESLPSPFGRRGEFELREGERKNDEVLAGSRCIRHKLQNNDERRRRYERAKQTGYLVLPRSFTTYHHNLQRKKDHASVVREGSTTTATAAALVTLLEFTITIA